MPDGAGLHLVGADGADVWSRAWPDLLGDAAGCAPCGGEGASADGDGLLVAFTDGGDRFSGGVARLHADGSLDFRVGGLTFPTTPCRTRSTTPSSSPRPR
ncbi:MAG: hypothetical protein R3F59_37100 [Myxococcota bacterium]